MSVKVLCIKHGEETRILYIPEGWEEGIRMGNPSDSYGMTYEHQVGKIWLDENGIEWVETPIKRCIFGPG